MTTACWRGAPAASTVLRLANVLIPRQRPWDALFDKALRRFRPASACCQPHICPTPTPVKPALANR
ncbi:hypothetical protein [Kribbella lupini]|uniref:hypothetical protein n=1 Tax=Kribbella lupini TaxID=291602 RepID=UPI0031D89EF7